MPGGKRGPTPRCTGLRAARCCGASALPFRVRLEAGELRTLGVAPQSRRVKAREVLMAEQFLKAIRKELRITQADLAHAAHIRQIDVSNIERGETKASDAQIAAFVRLISARAASRAFEHVILAAWPEAE